MILPGNLRSTTLGDVLGQLHRGGVSGVLHIISGPGPWSGCHHHITLVGGIVRDVSTPIPALRIGEVLVQQGILTREDYERFASLLERRPGSVAGVLLVEMGLASNATLRYALSRQMRMRLDKLFAVESGELRFHPLARIRTTSSVALGPRDFLHGRARARDRRGTTGAPHRAEGAECKDTEERAAARDAALDLLGLPPGASRAQVRQAFRRVAVQVHPDLHGSLGERELAAMQARFAEYSRAYHLLITDPCSAAEGTEDAA